MRQDIRIIEQGTPEEASDMALAAQVGAALLRAYPAHPWIVSVQGNALVVRHMAIANAMCMATGREGFGTILPRNRFNTPTELRQTAIRFGGELLEAFGMKRGQWDGDEPKVPERWRKRGTVNTRPNFQ